MKKILPLLLIFIPSICFGLTYSTKTICPSGCDYTTTVLWEAGEQGDNVARDSVTVGNITTGFTEYLGTARLWFSGWTTDTSHYIRLYTSGTARHNGTWGNNYYAIVSSINGYGCVYQEHGAKDLQLDGLQIESNNATNGKGIETDLDAYAGKTGNFDVSNCIVRSFATAPGYGSSIGIDASYSSGTIRIWNNTIYGFGSGIFHGTVPTKYKLIIYNNTLYETGRSPNSVNASMRIRPLTAITDVYMKNNLVYSTTACYYLNGITVTVSSNNISNDATSPETALRNQKANYVNTTAYNFQPISTDTTTFQGLNLSTDLDGLLSFNTDASGATRGATWTIGAMERQATVSARKRRIIANIIQ